MHAVGARHRVLLRRWYALLNRGALECVPTPNGRASCMDPVARCARAAAAATTHSESAWGCQCRPSVRPSVRPSYGVAADLGAPTDHLRLALLCVCAPCARVCEGRNGKWRVEPTRAVVVREAKVSKPLQVME
jgi:hypothetical protein